MDILGSNDCVLNIENTSWIYHSLNIIIISVVFIHLRGGGGGLEACTWWSDLPNIFYVKRDWGYLRETRCVIYYLRAKLCKSPKIGI